MESECLLKAKLTVFTAETSLSRFRAVSLSEYLLVALRKAESRPQGL